MHNRTCQQILMVVATLSMIPSSVTAADREAAEHVRAAIKAYESGEYDKAQEQFTEAELKCPECPEIAYNRGLASYRQRDFSAARDFFNAALQTRDLDLESRTKYNLGNVAYSEALEKMSDLKESIELARSAIFHYRDALELNPKDEDARANIEIAQLLIKDLLDKQKQEQEKQDQQNQQENDQNQQNQDQQDQQKQDQKDGEEGEKNDEQQKQEGEQDQDKKDEQQKEDGEKGDEKKDPQSQKNDEQQKKDQHDQQPSDDQQQNPQDQQQQQAASQQERKLTDEELARMLQAVRDKEAQRRQENKRRMRVRQAPVLKDW
ncbi:MAG TPA: tetratricopeptide repeat protein [Phycisphaerae bacterium]|nr:tetratricopeptide repeat protein [Phycisphaerae bacterium]